MKEILDHNVIIDAAVVIDETFHRVQNRFVSCNAGLNRSAWNTTDPRRVCFKCFPLESDRADLNEEIERRAQIELF